MFKTKHTFEERFSESERIIKKFPDKVPIICEKNGNQLELKELEKSKYLVPWDYTIGQFLYIIRKQLQLGKEEALFMIVGNHISSASALLGHIYELYKDLDGFLYIQYTKENTFG